MAKTQKVGNQELRFMCSAHRLIGLFNVLKCRADLSYGADTYNESADGRTDTQNFGRYNIIPSLPFVEGHKKQEDHDGPISLT